MKRISVNVKVCKKISFIDACAPNGNYQQLSKSSLAQCCQSPTRMRMQLLKNALKIYYIFCKSRRINLSSQYRKGSLTLWATTLRTKTLRSNTLQARDIVGKDIWGQIRF